MSYRDQSVAQLKVFEGVVPWMYLDTVGLCTVGVGNMLPDVGTAVRLPFNTSAGVMATPDEIGDDYDRVMSLPKGLKSTAYRIASSLTLGNADIDALTMARVVDFEAQLKTLYPDYDTYPDTVKMALIDLIFNLGLGGLKKYVLLGDSVRRMDWVSAANQCARNSHNPAFNDRNAWCKTQFLSSV